MDSNIINLKKNLNNIKKVAPKKVTTNNNKKDNSNNNVKKVGKLTNKIL